MDKQTFIPGRTKLEPGQTLAPDPSTYEMLHTLSAPWPCLSFDIVRDSLGDNRKTFPATVYAVAGTQAEAPRAKENELLVLKLSGLGKMERDNETDSESDSDSDDESPSDPILESKSIPLNSTTNRIRVHQTPHPSGDASKPPQTITATMLENSQVLIHDVTAHLSSFDVPGTVIPPSASKPLCTLRMHKSEGYALDWSPLQPLGKLLTGDNDGLIYVTTRTEGGGWVTDSRPFVGHTSSVEELQWSPNEKNVFASASSDGTVKVWDVRSKSRKPAVDVKISNTDVNVMSWSRLTFHLLATGADDGQWAVWDLRHWKPSASSGSSSQLKPSPVASFDFHREPITSIEWHPTDDSVIAVSSADNTVTLWDLAVELDDEESKDAGMPDVPPQLLFVHYMESVKEVHWQAQMPGTVMATGANGFGYVSLFLSLPLPFFYFLLVPLHSPNTAQLTTSTIQQSLQDHQRLDIQDRRHRSRLSIVQYSTVQYIEEPKYQKANVFTIYIYMDMDMDMWTTLYCVYPHLRSPGQLMSGWVLYYIILKKEFKCTIRFDCHEKSPDPDRFQISCGETHRAFLILFPFQHVLYKFIECNLTSLSLLSSLFGLWIGSEHGHNLSNPNSGRALGFGANSALPGGGGGGSSRRTLPYEVMRRSMSVRPDLIIS